MAKRTNTAAWMEKQSRWQINVQKDGQRRSFYSSKPGRTGQREANAKADAWLDDNMVDTNTRVTVLLDEYLERAKATTGDGNYRNESYRVNFFIRPAIGNRKISSITEGDLQTIIDKAYRKVDPKTGETVERSRKTLTNIRATISAFFKFCRLKKVSTLFPENLSIPKGARYKGVKILQPDDLQILFSVDTTFWGRKRVFDEYIYAYRFIVLTGLRPGELQAIQKTWIDGNRVNISGSINYRQQKTHGKNENAVRAITMSDLARRTLEKQLQIAPPGELAFGQIKNPQHFWQRWVRYCESNGVTKTSLYALRHTFVSIVKTLPEGKVKSLVGHSKNMDTFGVYGHELSGETDLTAQDINQLFSDILKSVL